MSDTVSLDEYDTAYDRAMEVLRAGGLVVLPTDTVYGVVADAFNPQATSKLRSAKRRGRQHPVPVIIRSPRQVTGMVADVPEAADRLMAAYWPGPLTLVFAVADGLTWDLGNTRGTVALRMPVDDLAMALVAEIGPLACTGANRHGQPVGATVGEAREQLGSAAALYVDGGPRTARPSTIVDVTGAETTVLRAGAIPPGHVLEVASGALGWGQQPAVSSAELSMGGAGLDGDEQEQ